MTSLINNVIYLLLLTTVLKLFLGWHIFTFLSSVLPCWLLRTEEILFQIMKKKKEYNTVIILVCIHIHKRLHVSV